VGLQLQEDQRAASTTAVMQVLQQLRPTSWAAHEGEFSFEAVAVTEQPRGASLQPLTLLAASGMQASSADRPSVGSSSSASSAAALTGVQRQLERALDAPSGASHSRLLHSSSILVDGSSSSSSWQHRVSLTQAATQPEQCQLLQPLLEGLVSAPLLAGIAAIAIGSCPPLRVSLVEAATASQPCCLLPASTLTRLICPAVLCAGRPVQPPRLHVSAG
jgi:hypothetical protein